jgi:hypothetical protein
MGNNQDILRDCCPIRNLGNQYPTAARIALLDRECLRYQFFPEGLMVAAWTKTRWRSEGIILIGCFSIMKSTNLT